MADIAKIPIYPGEQIWGLIRTDRDGASAEQISASIGDFMRWNLRNAKVAGVGVTELHQVISTGPNEWRVGAARPIQLVSVSHERPTYPPGKVYASRETYPGEGIPTVSGNNAWWVVIRFWWRAAQTEVEWPSLIARVGSLTGFNLADYTVDQADWVLDRALVPETIAQDPGDPTWGQAQGKRVEEAVSSIGSGAIKVGLGIAVIAALWAIFRRR